MDYIDYLKRQPYFRYVPMHALIAFNYVAIKRIKLVEKAMKAVPKSIYANH